MLKIYMVSHKYKVLFFHIPKTAGQSIESHFLNLHSLNWEERETLLLKPNDDPLITKVNRLYEKDIDTFKYTFKS